VSGAPGTVDIVSDVAEAFAETVLAAYTGRDGPRFVLVLSGGPTARRCYQRLAQRAVRRIDWSLVDIYMGDERCVAPDDPDANQRLVREALIDAVGKVGSFRAMSCEEGPEAYQRVISDVVAFDVVHLGLGPDGHTASLFPGSPALDAPPGRLVMCSTDPDGRNRHERMTLTLEALALAHLVVFTVSGESKRDAFAALSSGADLPAARVRARQVVWLVDREAAGQAGSAQDDG
jgi:6-phosphogluconolactonase